MEIEYQKAGTEGAFKAGVEGGKLIFDIAGTFAGGAGLAKGGVNFVEKVSTKIISKQLVNGKPIIFANGFYSVNGMKISQSYYDRLWQQGRPAPFIQASEVLKNNPKITADPQGAPGYYRYEAVGLEMIYNPTTGQIGHIQPIKTK